MAADSNSTVYIGNLDERVSNRVLYDILIQAGRVVDLHFPQDNETGKPKGYAFATYESEEIAEYAVKLFSGLVTLYKRTVKFEISEQDKSSRDGSSRRPRKRRKNTDVRPDIDEHQSNRYINVRPHIDEHRSNRYRNVRPDIADHQSNRYRNVRPDIDEHRSNRYRNVRPDIDEHRSNRYRNVRPDIDEHRSNRYRNVRPDIADHQSNRYRNVRPDIDEHQSNRYRNVRPDIDEHQSSRYRSYHESTDYSYSRRVSDSEPDRVGRSSSRRYDRRDSTNRDPDH